MFFSAHLPCEIVDANFGDFVWKSQILVDFQSISIDFLLSLINFDQFQSVSVSVLISLISLTRSKTAELIDNRKVGKSKRHFRASKHLLHTLTFCTCAWKTNSGKNSNVMFVPKRKCYCWCAARSLITQKNSCQEFPRNQCAVSSGEIQKGTGGRGRDRKCHKLS